MNPLLYWVGNKRKLATSLAAEFRRGKHQRLVEPFAGAAALFYALEPRRALLIDTCGPLMNFYRVLQEDPTGLHRALTKLRKLAPQPDPDSYYLVREVFNCGPEDASLRAAYFFYLNRVAYQGVWRVNRAGLMNTPYGGRKNPVFPSKDDLIAASLLTNRAKVAMTDFKYGFAGAGPGDFIYCDPPYHTTFDGYGSKGFTLEDHERLAECCAIARKAGATVYVSNSDTKAVRKLYPSKRWDFTRVELQKIAPHNVRGQRKPEVLIVGRAA